MRTIQDVGLEIFNHTPAKFYAFLGPEYGIKCRYLDMIAETYKGSVVEADSVQSVISMMKTKHIVPLQPSLYIVRYDETYLSSLDNASFTKLKDIKMIGTLVMIYQTEKQCSKVEKYLPDISVYVGHVDTKFVEKYLKQDFPNLDSRLVKLAAYCGTDYGHAKNIGGCMNSVPSKEFMSYQDSDICKLFGKVDEVDDKILQIHIAARDVNFLMSNMSKFLENTDNTIYTLMSTMVEFDKIWGNKYSDSPIKKYQKVWSREDVYYVFMHGYHQLRLRRSISVNDENQLITLFSLLSFSPVPSIEEV